VFDASFDDMVIYRDKKYCCCCCQVIKRQASTEQAPIIKQAMLAPIKKNNKKARFFGSRPKLCFLKSCKSLFIFVDVEKKASLLVPDSFSTSMLQPRCRHRPQSLLVLVTVGSYYEYKQ
jgi:hypothetical protein